MPGRQRPRPIDALEKAHRARVQSLIEARDAINALLDDAVRHALMIGVPYEVIARDVGVSKPTLFNRYGTLESLRRDAALLGKDYT